MLERFDFAESIDERCHEDEDRDNCECHQYSWVVERNACLPVRVGVLVDIDNVGRFGAVTKLLGLGYELQGDLSVGQVLMQGNDFPELWVVIE